MGQIVSNYGDPEALGAQPEMTEAVFHAFAERVYRRGWATLECRCIQ